MKVPTHEIDTYMNPDHLHQYVIFLTKNIAKLIQIKMLILKDYVQHLITFLM